MSEEDEKAVEEATAPRGRKPLLLATVLVASIAVGGAVGVFVAVPLLVGSPAAVPSVGAVNADSATDERPRSSRSGRESPPILFTIDNMVLNPKGTGGTRFLMVTTALEVSDTRVLDQMRQREHEVRDLLLTTYAQKSVEELTDLSLRESLREDVRAAMESLLHRGAIERVYLPQFVIQ
jgi:flagellar protein FliL